MNVGDFRLAVLVAMLFQSGAILKAQTAYKYRDIEGHLVFTDQMPISASRSDSFALGHEKTTVRILVFREDSPEQMKLIAVNDCLCVVTFKVSIVHSSFPSISEGTNYLSTLAPQSRQVLVEAARRRPDEIALEYLLKAALGSPDAIHNPARPYRVPFSVGSTYRISQSYPETFTHTSADSQFAVDIALPDGTPIYSAREGLVINARHDSFRGAPVAEMLDQANFIEILHDDGTIAIYAHLHWDSIRVRIGDLVVRGQYIANSGNTGFASGPHLHFAVVRNSGVENVSIPVQFTGIGGIGVTPITNMQLTAY